MGIDIHGWVEVRPDYYNPIAKSYSSRQWDAAIKVDYLLRRNSALYHEMFNVRGKADYPSSLAQRGIPDGASEGVEVDYLAVADDPDGSVAPTWITWAELKAAYPRKSNGEGIRGARGFEFGSDWLLLFDLMARLARDYTDDGVRLVVWFDW
jgi:hypothetical protein